MPTNLVKHCTSCDGSYTPRRNSQRFCSPKCRLIAFQRRQDNARIDREAKIRFYLQQALALLGPGHDVAYGDNRGTHQTVGSGGNSAISFVASLKH